MRKPFFGAFVFLGVNLLAQIRVQRMYNRQHTFGATDQASAHRLFLIQVCWHRPLFMASKDPWHRSAGADQGSAHVQSFNTRQMAQTILVPITNIGTGLLAQSNFQCISVHLLESAGWRESFWRVHFLKRASKRSQKSVARTYFLSTVIHSYKPAHVEQMFCCTTFEC